MKINNLERMKMDDTYVSQDYIVAIESHLTYLKATATIKNITKQQSYKFEGDLYGLLMELGYEPNYFYVTMRLNNLINPSDYKGDTEFIYLPDQREVSKIVTILETKKE